MLNLVGNAVKFTDEGEVGVRAWLDEAEGVIRVEVADTGIGIAAERKPGLFTEFSSHDGSYSSRRPGTGLGLAISKGLVERMGGSITVESDGVNRGTRVRIDFPAEHVADSRPARPTVESQA
jgi:signal transduction histidine kinase